MAMTKSEIIVRDYDEANEKVLEADVKIRELNLELDSLHSLQRRTEACIKALEKSKEEQESNLSASRYKLSVLINYINEARSKVRKRNKLKEKLEKLERMKTNVKQWADVL